MKKTLKQRDVDSYIAAAPKEMRGKLKEIRKVIRETAPEAVEKISYRIPYYSYKGRLAYFAFAKKHIGLYAMLGAMKKHESKVNKYRTGKATLQFPLDKNIPISLIKLLVKTQMKINEGKNKFK